MIEVIESKDCVNIKLTQDMLIRFFYSELLSEHKFSFIDEGVEFNITMDDETYSYFRAKFIRAARGYNAYKGRRSRYGSVKSLKQRWRMWR